MSFFVAIFLILIIKYNIRSKISSLRAIASFEKFFSFLSFFFFHDETFILWRISICDFIINIGRIIIIFFERNNCKVNGMEIIEIYLLSLKSILRKFNQLPYHLFSILHGNSKKEKKYVTLDRAIGASNKTRTIDN